MTLKLLMIVNDSQIAKFVASNGVDILFVDLEHLGKEDRQKNLASWKSEQTPEDLTRIRNAAPEAKILTRVNPIHSNTAAEVDDVIARGTDIIMLPMFRIADELVKFFDIVNGRVPIRPLFETVNSIKLIPKVLDLVPIKDLHFGLNDLSLEMNYSFMFQPIADGILENACEELAARNINFGIGGIARAGEGILSPEFLLGEHVRLGSSSAILSRTFHRNAVSLRDLEESLDFSAEIKKLHKIYDSFLDSSNEFLEQNRQRTADKINDVVSVINRSKAGKN